MGRLMSWRLFRARFFSSRAFWRSSLVRIWYHLHSHNPSIVTGVTWQASCCCD